MRAIETTKIHAARYLHARYGVSPAWLQRRIKNDVFPQPIKLGVTPDALTVSRIFDTDFPRPIRSSRKSAPRSRRPASIARNAELARTNGGAS